MLYLDSAIVNVIERACRRFQRLTGRTNVWLALQLTNLSRDAAMRALIAVFCAGLLYVLIKTLFRESIEAYEKSTYERVARGVKNPRRQRDALLRIAFLTLAIFLWYPAVIVYMEWRLQALLLTYPLIALTTAVLYLLACDPLPPVEVKAEAPAAARKPLETAT
jgi:hypothetical protein